MHITLEKWTAYKSSNSKKRKRSASLRAIHAHVTGIREARRNARPKFFVTTRQKLDAMRGNAAASKRRAEIEAADAKAAATRASLIAAGRVARQMGFMVRSSESRNGNISSYYAKRSNVRPIRISDHRLPTTAKRDSQAEFYGGSAFSAEIIIDRPMTVTRLRRLLVLAEAEREFW